MNTLNNQSNQPSEGRFITPSGRAHGAIGAAQRSLRGQHTAESWFVPCERSLGQALFRSSCSFVKSSAGARRRFYEIYALSGTCGARAPGYPAVARHSGASNPSDQPNPTEIARTTPPSAQVRRSGFRRNRSSAVPKATYGLCSGLRQMDNLGLALIVCGVAFPLQRVYFSPAHGTHFISGVR
jgi:hypothetical protein